MSVVEAGTVASVDTKPVGSPVVGTAASGALSVFVNDNAKFSPSDEVYITPLDADTGDYYVIDAVDDEQGITLTTALVDDLADGSWVALSPVRTATIATVQLAESGEVRPCVVLHTLRDAFRDGIRDPADAETVLTVLAGGVRYVFDIIAQAPVRDITDSVVGDQPIGDVLQGIYDTADDNAAAAADAAANATTALTAANGKNTVTYSLSSPGTTPNTAGDIWFRKDSATQTVIEQWEGRGGTTWQQVTLANAVIANLDAGKLTAGSAFINGLSVKTNLTLGDASVNGVIQSYNFAGSSVGVYIDKFGIVAKGGSLSGATITGATLAGSNAVSSSGSVYAGVLGGARVALLGSSADLAFYNSGGSLVGRLSGNDGYGGISTVGYAFKAAGTVEFGRLVSGTPTGTADIYSAHTNVYGHLYLGLGMESDIDMNGYDVRDVGSLDVGSLTFQSWGAVSRGAAGSGGGGTGAGGYMLLRVPNP